MEQVVQSFNIFVDTDRGDGVHKGDDFTLNLNDVNIEATNEQHVRITVTNFSMYKTFTNVNANNSRFTIRTDADVGHVDLPHRNHESIHKLAEDFAETVKDEVVRQAIVNGSTATQNNTIISLLQPSSATAPAGTSNNIISFRVNFQAAGNTPVAHNLTECLVHFYEKSPDGNVDSDIYSLLGGKRISDNTDTTTNSITTDITNANYIDFTCIYPAQRHTEQFIYLRTSLPTKNLCTSSLDSGTNNHHREDVHHTNIVARFPIDTEVVNYTAQLEKEFFIDLKMHHLTNIRFFLTDHHNRKIPLMADDQNTLGNLNFNMILRCDIIQNPPNKREPYFDTANYPKRYNNVLVKDNGFNRY